MPRCDMDDEEEEVYDEEEDEFDEEEEEYDEDREQLFDDDDDYRNVTLSGSPLSLGKALKHSRTKYTAKSSMPRRDMYDEEEEEYDEDREQLFDDADDCGGRKRKRRAHSPVFDVKEEEGAEGGSI